MQITDVAMACGMHLMNRDWGKKTCSKLYMTVCMSGSNWEWEGRGEENCKFTDCLKVERD